MIDRKFRKPRKWSNEQLRSIAFLFKGEVANVSGWMDDDKEGEKYRNYFCNSSAYHVTNYSGERGFQGESDEIFLNLEEKLDSKLVERFDVVFNHTTLEHIYDFHLAFRNLCRMTRDVLIIVVPFLQEVHFTNDYKDYWRFTPFSLKRLFNDNNMEMIYYSSNGNDRKNSIYILAVGSKKPEGWEMEFPKKPDISNEVLGRWVIRNGIWYKVGAFLKVIISRCKNHNVW